MSLFFQDKRVLVTGGHGFLGSHVVRLLKLRGVTRLFTPSIAELDLREQASCARAVYGMGIVIHLAAKVGGIGYNLEVPGEMFYDNIIMNTHLMEEARKAGVAKYVSIGTICSYPKIVPIPFREKDLWAGYPEETNAPYGLAKKMQLVQAQAYREQYGFNAIHLLPVNMYGPGDNFDPQTSHVIPALIRRFHEAKIKKNPEVVVWGTGSATREFLYVEDGAEAIVLATERYHKKEPVNIGSSSEISIRDLAKLIKNLVGYRGRIVWDKKKPDGQPRRKVDTSCAKREFGFVAKTNFETGLRRTIDWYLSHIATG